MIRPTSRAAFTALNIPDAQARALLALRLHGPNITAAELERDSGERHINKRLSELRNTGHAHESGRRRCAVSGKQALTWTAGPGEGTGIHRRAVTSIAPMRATDHDCDRSKLRTVGDTCTCGRYVVHVDERASIGGVVCRVTTTHGGIE